MATVGPSSASTGPRYAPEDPSLPKPWLGLIDGSTGLLYYWNPETNITQYEKPASLPPPLPPGPPPTASTPKLAQLPVANSVQPNGLVAQATQQITQAMLQQGQQVSQSPLQHGQAMAQYQASSVAQVSNLQGAQQQGSQLGQTMQQPGQLRPQMMQHPGQQMLSYIGQQMPQQGGQQLAQHPGQPIQQQAIQQMPPHQSMQMPPPHGQQYIYQQTHYMAYQQSILQHGQQNSQQQNQLSAQGLQFPNQNEYKAGPPKREEGDFEQANQTGSSPAHFQQAGASSLHNLPAGSTPVSAGIHAGQAQQFGGSAPNMKQPSSVVQLQSDIGHQQHGSRLPNQMGASAMHSQQSTAPPVGLNIGYERNVHGMGGSDYYFSPKLEGPAMTPSQPNLAAIPMARNQQESRMGGVPFKDVTPGYASGFNSAGHSMNNTYSHAPAGPPFLNNAFVRPPFTGTSDISNLSPAEVYCQEHEVTATGDNIPPPFMTFESTGFPVEILRDIHSAGFLSPTPIQAQTWPIALQNRDIVAIAKTGSGKTLGYLIPAFILLRKRRNNPQNGPTVLVLAPTRELATQIQDEAIKFGHSSRVSCTCLYGGAPKGPQLKELDRGADIVVATPGRLNDVLEMKKVNFQQVSLFVLDEADRMLDMGFEPQIRKIVNEMPPRRQTLMYTATWPKEVRKIASDLLFNPVQVNIGSVDELAANKSITQYVEVVPQMEKDRRLEQILRAQERGSKVIIFCSTKKLCDQLARSIGRKFGATAIHGDKSQAERDWVLNQFRSGKSPVLVATDVAARGLDIKDIRVVINYDFPTGIEDYVHRIGRTGRAGATGVSYTFFSEQDSKYAVDLIKVLEGANQHVPSEIRDIALRGGPIVGKDRGMVNHFDSAPAGSGRWESSGRGGMRDGFGARGGMRDGFWGRGGMRDGGFGGRGGMRDGSFTGRGGMRDVGFGARGGMRDGPFNSRGGRNDSFSGRGNRGRGFSGPIGGNGSWDRNERGPHDRYNYMDSRGRGRGRGRGRFDGRRNNTDRGRGRSYSRSPERFRTWGYSRSKSKSRSRSRSQSRSWSRDRSRSYSRSPRRGRSYSRSPRRSRSYSRSPRRSRSYSHSPRRSRSYSRSPRRSRSYSRSPQRSRSYSRSPQHGHGHGHSHSSRNDRFGSPNDKSCIEKNAAVPEVKASGPGMSPMSPGTHGDAFSGAEQVTAVVNAESTLLEAPADQSLQSVQET